MLLEHIATEPKTSEQNDVLLSIQKAVKVPIKYIYIIRNPFDIAATRMYHKTNMGVKDRNTLYKNPVSTIVHTEFKYLDLMRTKKKIFNMSVIPGFRTLQVHAGKPVKV